MNARQPGASTARQHLELRTVVVTVRLLALLDDAVDRGIFGREDLQRRFPFLDAYGDHLGELAGGRKVAGARKVAGVSKLARDPAHFRKLAAELARSATELPPLARLAESGLGGDPAEAEVLVDIVVSAALVERDARFGEVITSLQSAGTSHRPCIGLLAVLLDREPELIAQAVAALARAGVVEIEDSGLPRAEQSLRLPSPVLSVIEGSQLHEPAIELTSAAQAPAVSDLIVPAEVADRIEQAVALLGRGELDAVVVRGRTGTGRKSTLRAVAGRLGRGLLVAAPVPGREALPAALAMLSGAMLAWSVEPGVGQLVVVPRPPDGGPLGIAIGRLGAVTVTDGDRTVLIDLSMPDPAERRQFWTATGLPAGKKVLDQLSQRYALSGGTIGRVAAQAVSLARVGERERVELGDVRQAAQDQSRQQLESLATLMPPLDPGFVPVLAGVTAQEYAALELRMRHREGLGAAVGGATGGQITRGVRAMLSGPSGTGKTLTARALGTSLSLDVYRADLAALVDKYIGETERRLDDLFTRAEDLDVVLLIDEGDALMTRRTDVRSSNDRYANLETDFLLQRLESYEGIVLITTNAPQLLDSAFLRRLDVTVPFVPPGAQEREQIWRLHLPQRHAVTSATLQELASRCRLTGGQIRNAAIHAALLALDANQLVDDRALIRAVSRELTSAGHTPPMLSGSVTVSPFERARAAP